MTVTTTPSNDAPTEEHIESAGTETVSTSAKEASAEVELTNPNSSSTPLRFVKNIAQQASAIATSAASSAAGAVVGATSTVVQQGTNLAVATASATLNTGQTFLAVTQGAVAAVIGAAAQGTWDSVTALTDTIQQSTTSAGGFIGERFADVLTNAGKVVTHAGGTLSSTVDALAGDPNTPESIHVQGLRIATGLLPVVGNAKGIGDARVKYKRALALAEGEERTKLLHQARRDCLIASSLLSIEIATIGASGAVDKALKAGNLFASVLNAGKTVREMTESSGWLPKIDVDTLSPRVDIALSFSPLREAMDIILRFDPERNDSTE
jgi:hypothetical protein